MDGDQMVIGIDLDHTLLGFPEFFREFIPAMAARGCKIVCTSNQKRHKWPEYERKLRDLGIDPDLIDPSLMQPGPRDEGMKNKVRMSQHCDVVFDDLDFNKHTDTPIFVCPHGKACDTKR